MELTQDGTLQFNDAVLTDRRLTQATVGLYAELVGHDGCRLWASLLRVAAAMLAVQLLVLRHSLKPLDSIGAEVCAIESGISNASPFAPLGIMSLKTTVQAFLLARPMDYLAAGCVPTQLSVVLVLA